ncbi:MAG: hypothetical protein ACYCSF_00295 [Acidimicrobiales bacterium]
MILDGMVVVVTEEDNLYVLSARTGVLEWALHLGSPARVTSIQGAPGLSGCGDIFPLGITGSPVIDENTGVAYVAGEVQQVGTSTWMA